MKKVYESPSVEKIAFRYRDQIVAASADNVNQENITGSNTRESSLCTTIDWIAREWGDWQLCLGNA